MLIETILAFGGLIVGLILAYFTKEELKSGAKYFSILERILLLVLVIFLLYKSWNSFVFLIVAFIAGFMFFIGVNRVYLYLGFSLFLASRFSQTYFYSFVGLIFLLGLAYGALYYIDNKDKNKLIYLVGLNAILFALPFLLIYVESFVFSYDFVFFPFAAGALFAKLLLR